MVSIFLDRLPPDWLLAWDDALNFSLLQFKLHTRVSTGRPGTNRDGTSRCPFVPGQKKSCPSVPLSRDKGRSKNPGTNSSVPGRPGTKLISIDLIALKNLERPFPVIERLFLFFVSLGK